MLQVSATDPDGPNNLIKYSLDIGAKVPSIYYVIVLREKGVHKKANVCLPSKGRCSVQKMTILLIY